MDRTATSAPDCPTAVRTARSAALYLLLPAAAGERREPAAAPAAGRTVPGMPVLRQPPHGHHAGGQPQTHPEALDREDLSVRAAHSRTGITAADFSRIRNANLARFTVDRLMSILNRLGSRVEGI